MPSMFSLLQIEVSIPQGPMKVRNAYTINAVDYDVIHDAVIALGCEIKMLQHDANSWSASHVIGDVRKELRLPA